MKDMKKSFSKKTLNNHALNLQVRLLFSFFIGFRSCESATMAVAACAFIFQYAKVHLIIPISITKKNQAIKKSKPSIFSFKVRIPNLYIKFAKICYFRRNRCPFPSSGHCCSRVCSYSVLAWTHLGSLVSPNTFQVAE